MDVSLFQRNNFNMNGNDDIKSLKNSMTLDFQSSGGRKRQPTAYSMNGANSNGNLIGPLWTPTAGPIQLESPDLKMCKLATPDIERFILSNTDNLATPTPSLAAPPVTMASDANGNYSQLKPAVTADMEQYARGFEDALQRLHNQDSNDVYTRPMSNSSSSSTNGSLSQVDTRLSATPNLPSVVSPPVSPINMEDQERIKLERKRLRNRIAASKCRRRKLEKIARLEEKVKQLKETNSELSISVKKLREHVCSLKEEVMQHVRDGCQLSSTAHFH